MDYYLATQAVVSEREAIAEIKQHGFDAVAYDSPTADERLLVVAGEVVAESNLGEYIGGDILNWLGY